MAILIRQPSHVRRLPNGWRRFDKVYERQGLTKLVFPLHSKHVSTIYGCTLAALRASCWAAAKVVEEHVLRKWEAAKVSTQVASHSNLKLAVQKNMGGVK